jgi:hypothetical protein
MQTRKNGSREKTSYGSEENFNCSSVSKVAILEINPLIFTATAYELTFLGNDLKHAIAIKAERRT